MIREYREVMRELGSSEISALEKVAPARRRKKLEEELGDELVKRIRKGEFDRVGLEPEHCDVLVLTASPAEMTKLELEEETASIQEECDAIGPVKVGDAVVTGAGELPARFVIHAASMPPGGEATEDSVRASMRRSLELANERGCRSVAVPAIGAGIAGFPLQRCAEILLEEARQHLAGDTSLEEVRFVLFGEPAYRVFESVQDAARIVEQAARWAKREP